MKIVYFVHDVYDAAVERRVRMFNAAGAHTTVLGFRRRDLPMKQLGSAPVIDLGRTEDARMVQRLGAVIGGLMHPGKLLEAAREADIIIGRNLEAFALACRAHAAAPKARLVYECLDIHRLLIESSFPARALQAVQSRLLRDTDLILTSSPAFEREYFRPNVHHLPPVYLVENKLLMLGSGPEPVSEQAPLPSQPPWTIGWFGMLRCRKTFDLLAELVRGSSGRIKVNIAGRPSPAQFADFEAMVADVPGFSFHGPYAPGDLPQLYASCHFAWAIDFFEEGLNSSWLLPNRIYEAMAHGVVPIALDSVEVGRWLVARNAGLVVPDAKASLREVLLTLDSQQVEQLQAQVAAVPVTDLVATKADCDALMAALDGLSVPEVTA
ncbi:hypothetical protein NVSP9465_03204 [Novosphingobium sp. CECT 9465]|nr:hypothetical protein NVSP9465_03204 [Novosphingobium sp. CECT 9465]